MRTRKRKSTLTDKYQFVTYVLDRMKLSIEQRKKKSKGIGEKIKDKTPRDLGPADTTVHTSIGGRTAIMCGDRNVACKRINDQYSLGQENRRRMG